MGLGNKIKQLRESKKYSQEELADLLRVHSVTISKWENGTQEPRAKKLNEIANIFGVSLEYLLADSSNHTNENGNFQRGLGTEENQTMAYWGKIADNVRNLADSGDKDKIISVAFMLKNALSSLLNKAGVNEKGIQNFYLSNNNIYHSFFGNGATA